MSGESWRERLLSPSEPVEIMKQKGELVELVVVIEFLLVVFFLMSCKDFCAFKWD